MRKLKYHEKKLLKKVDFLSWEIDNNLHEVRVMKKYYIQKREDYTKWESYIVQYRYVKRMFIVSPGLATRRPCTRYQNYAHGGNNYSWH